MNVTEPHEPCTLLNGGFDRSVQIVLGFIAMLILIVKRYGEYPMRPLKVRSTLDWPDIWLVVIQL